jgi:hypothetical protein
MLTFIEKIPGTRKANYKCDCGADTTAYTYDVKSGNTKSCGCLRKAVSSERSKTHGHKSNGKRSTTYVAWVNMKRRCSDIHGRDYANYGGRGITVCERWQTFENFLTDMGEPSAGETLDRIDNSLGYSKDNCRWVSRAVQNLNKRSCVRYELNGKNQTLAEWARETGINRTTLWLRIKNGVPLGLALTTKGFLGYRRAA